MGLISASEKEKAKINEVIKYLTNVRDRNAVSSPDMEKNISDLLDAADSLAEIEDRDMSGIRLLIDQMLVFWQGRWYLNADPSTK